MENKKIRVQAIDGIRGFSLLGILLANLLIFQYGFWGKDEMAFFSLSSADSFMNIPFYEFSWKKVLCQFSPFYLATQ